MSPAEGIEKKGLEVEEEESGDRVKWLPYAGLTAHNQMAREKYKKSFIENVLIKNMLLYEEMFVYRIFMEPLNSLKHNSSSLLV